MQGKGRQVSFYWNSKLIYTGDFVDGKNMDKELQNLETEIDMKGDGNMVKKMVLELNTMQIETKNMKANGEEHIFMVMVFCIRKMEQ
jgi:hypothetical protein